MTKHHCHFPEMKHRSDSAQEWFSTGVIYYEGDSVKIVTDTRAEPEIDRNSEE